VEQGRVARVVSGDVVTSPLTGARAAFAHIELVEAERTVAELIVGDVVSFALDDRADAIVSLVVRRAAFRRVVIARPPTPLERVPPELVPLLARTSGGPVGYRERLFVRGERVLLRARIEERDGRFVVRDDLAPIQLDELLGDPYAGS
jgi:hypothetical protein